MNKYPGMFQENLETARLVLRGCLHGSKNKKYLTKANVMYVFQYLKIVLMFQINFNLKRKGKSLQSWPSSFINLTPLSREAGTLA
jgi:hypothetical protein